MNRTSMIAVVLAGVGVLAAPGVASGATKTMYVGDDFFSRSATTITSPKITLRKNDILRWRWVGEEMHNVRVKIGTRTYLSDYQRDGTYSKRFRRAGTYTAVCDLHQNVMRMKVTVR